MNNISLQLVRLVLINFQSSFGSFKMHLFHVINQIHSQNNHCKQWSFPHIVQIKTFSYFYIEGGGGGP